ncbi:hypothetical protein J6590_078776, partial [Homalodisca vitripennis]
SQRARDLAVMGRTLQLSQASWTPGGVFNNLWELIDIVVSCHSETARVETPAFGVHF